MNTLKSIFIKVTSNKYVMAVVHTFWQAFTAVFLVGIAPIFQSTIATHYSDAKTALVALVVASVAAGLSAVKNYIVSRKN